MVKLMPEDNTLNDVVVTALGVSREKKALGYAVSEVKGSDLIKSRGGLNNPVNALTGKVAGLQISSGAGSMGGSSKILIRGVSSLSGNNQPLFVVDGVPIEGADYNSTETAQAAVAVTTTVTSFRISTPTISTTYRCSRDRPPRHSMAVAPPTVSS
jgi:outer membrane cobalamin receptor